MPIDPDISLQVAGGGGQGAPAAPAAVNPLGITSGLVNTMTGIQQLRQLNMTLQARQRASEIIASSPDMDTAIQGILHDPIAAFGSGETINQFRQSQLAMTQVQGEVQKQATSGMEATLHGLTGALNDPRMFNPTVQAYLQTLSPAARAEVAPAVDSLKRGLVDTATSPGDYQNNLAALLMGSGISPDTIRGVTGALPPTVATGPYGPGGAQTPAIIGGPAAGGASPSLYAPPPSTAGGPAPVPAGAGGPQGPSQATTAFNTKRAQDITDELNSLDERAQVGGTILNTLTEARNAQQLMKAGGGASTYAKVGQLAQALGAPQDLVDRLANGDLAASQEFTKLMVNTTMGQIQNQVPPGSKLNQQEFKVFNANNPNLDTDPRAIDKIFDFWTRIYNRDYQEQQQFSAARKEPGFDVLDWPARWQKYQHDTGMIQPSTGLAGSQQPAVPAGGVPAGAKHWIIQDGKLVPAGAP
jgi:hypothetical protein